MAAMVRGPTPINILLVEDDPSDVELTRRALQRAKLQNRVWIVVDGVEALAFLRREGPHHGVPRPDLVLLDLKLPNLDGRDVLMRIREEPRWQALPVVVDRKSTRLNSSHGYISYAVFCLKKKNALKRQILQLRLPCNAYLLLVLQLHYIVGGYFRPSCCDSVSVRGTSTHVITRAGCRLR